MCCSGVGWLPRLGPRLFRLEEGLGRERLDAMRAARRSFTTPTLASVGAPDSGARAELGVTAAICGVWVSADGDSKRAMLAKNAECLFYDSMLRLCMTVCSVETYG